MKALGKLPILLFALFILATGLWYGWYRYVVSSFPDIVTITEAQAKVMAARGQLGDMFGGVNALFTAFLLAGSLYTIWLQQKQIAILQDQRSAQERDSRHLARLQAMAALVNARSTLIEFRYEMSRDFAIGTKDKTVEPQWMGFWQMMAFANAEAANKEFQSLGELASQLELEVQSKAEGAA